MGEYSHCKTCKAMCYSEHMVDGECVRCTRRRMKQLKKKIKKLEASRCGSSG